MSEERDESVEQIVRELHGPRLGPRCKTATCAMANQIRRAVQAGRALGLSEINTESLIDAAMDRIIENLAKARRVGE